MTVIVATHTPPAIRGLLKRWFIEPKPNVFVGTINRRTREKTLEYIRRHAPNLGMLIIASAPNCQGFTIREIGDTKRRMTDLGGLQLILEQWDEAPEDSETAADPGPDTLFPDWQP